MVAERLAALEAKVAAAVVRSRAPAMLRAYRSDWKDFRPVLQAAGRRRPAAAPAVVAGYVAELADPPDDRSPARVSTITRRLAATARALLRDGIGMDRLRRARESGPRRLPPDHGHLEMVEASYPHLREFAPAVLAAVRFDGGAAARPLLEAVLASGAGPIRLSEEGELVIPPLTAESVRPTPTRCGTS